MTTTTQKAEMPVSKSSKTSTWHHYRQWLPSLLWIVAAGLLLLSMSFPYWTLVLHAPQYPDGLQMRVFVNRMTGDEDPKRDEVAEIEGLNHYIGMKPLHEAAQFERSIAQPAVILMIIFLLVASFWRNRWTRLLTIPSLGFPVIFLADLGFWMNYYGQNLDPSAPLSSAIHPFTPTLIGTGVIGQFSTVASVNIGWYLVAAASILVIVGLIIVWLQARSNRASVK